MNLCFIMGKIVSEIEFDFVIGNEEYFSKKENISLVRFYIDALEEKINIIGYNEIADYSYQKLNVGDNVFIEGFLRTDGKVQIEELTFWY